MGSDTNKNDDMTFLILLMAGLVLALASGTLPQN
jgi:hypothetical protein